MLSPTQNTKQLKFKDRSWRDTHYCMITFYSDTWSIKLLLHACFLTQVVIFALISDMPLQDQLWRSGKVHSTWPDIATLKGQLKFKDIRWQQCRTHNHVLYMYTYVSTCITQYTWSINFTLKTFESISRSVFTLIKLQFQDQLNSSLGTSKHAA